MPNELRSQLEQLDWTQLKLARLLHCDGRMVRWWATGRSIPPPVAAWLARCVEHHDRNPDPPAPEAYLWKGDAKMARKFTGQDLATMLRRLGWSQAKFAGLVEADEKLVKGWLDDAKPVPLLISTWLAKVWSHRTRHPYPAPPKSWEWKYLREKNEQAELVSA